MLLEAHKARLVVECCVLLHNFLRKSTTSRNTYKPAGTFDRIVDGEFIEGLWRQDAQGLTSCLPLLSVVRRSCNNTKEIRDEFANYFTTVGRVLWQEYLQ